jgi:hypothetical protein
MGATGRTTLLFTLGALLATLLPGVCAADCASFMECCRRAPAPDTVVSSSTCCRAEQPDISGPSAAPAEVRIKPARETSSSAPFVVHAPVLMGGASVAQATPDHSRSHRAPDVPLYLMNAAVLC